MKLLHTADWHIGQLFHEYDRTYEHQQFLNWLVETLTNEQIDVLLISGDVFDLSNPSANALKMFYTFLNRAVKSNPGLQIVVTAGNHDSASRLESPTPLLESSNIHIIGLIEKDTEENFVYEKLTIPLKDKQGNIKAWCLAIPFLRMGDYPVIADCENPYTEGVTALYKAAYEYALENKQPGQAIIAMGHLHAQQAEITEQDKTERLIMGGVECISASAFHEDIKYVALGHIHKAQRIGGKEHVRYCGSPLPMSFSEINYKHQVIVFELNDENITALAPIDVPVVIPLLRSPAVHSKLTEVLTALEQLPNINSQAEPAPYLEVRVLLDGPEPALRHKIEMSLTGKHVRLAKIDVRYASSTTTDTQPEMVASQNLNDLQPLEVFSKVYQSKYNNTVPPELLEMFNAIAQEATLTD
ncbi:exonuclease SbcCD subunit D C-terminal domain-containing protein [Chitinophaga sancti]|uniref:exonuclease SbcCD subunit D n=1 Tax=Chitinophaga sancti TaxID=1004 RepID=UPI002A756E93|nr:exonuclease SbcCD subunit D C-terminal domain-containing protein [Chitinophaga sancti]WPQ66089.1 exonuclease SbcCD subunit D C-terminal domain-containing protein [Chitinophaga sancti]